MDERYVMITENNAPATAGGNAVTQAKLISSLPMDQMRDHLFYSENSDGTANSMLATAPFVVGLTLGPNSLPLAITVSLDDNPSALTIDDIFTPGLIAGWNNSHTEAMCVYRGDIIVAVNNFAGSGKEMLEMLSNLEGLRHEEILMLHIKPGVNRTRSQQRPLKTMLQNGPESPRVILTESFNVRRGFIVDGNLWPGSMNLGVAISVDDHPSHLTIESLWSAGLIAHWNNTHPDTERVRKGDYISSVNDKVDFAEMLNQIDEAQKISIHRISAIKLRIEPGCGLIALQGKNTERKSPIFY